MNKVIAHYDLDGVVSVALIMKVMEIKKVIFSNENDFMKNKIDKDTIVVDLPYDERCRMWFDHHSSNNINKKFKGKFVLEKSCARIIFDYYKEYSSYYKDLVEQLDKADAGEFTLEDIKKEIPLFLLNSILFSYLFKNGKDKILNKVLSLILKEVSIDEIIKDREIKGIVKDFKKLNKEALGFIKDKAKVEDGILIVDSSDKERMFQSFTVFSEYPKIKYLVIIRKSFSGNKLSILIARNKFNNFNQELDIGYICKEYGGGGHKGIGGFRFGKENKNKIVRKIIEELK